MRKSATLLWMVGLTLLITLIIYHGIADVMDAVAVAGWGLLLVSLYSLVILFADTKGWEELLPRASRPSFFTLLWMRWICSAINSLLPVIQIGGDLARARLLALQKVPGAIAGASVVVDITAAVFSQIVFSLLGVLFLFHQHGAGSTLIAAVIGISVLALLVLGFYLVQRYGLFLNLVHMLERLVKIDYWKNVTGNAKALDNAVNNIYQSRSEFLAACSWRLLGWIVGTGEVWLALYFLGHPITMVEALVLESIGQAVRSSAFMIPGAYGVQEGGFILLSTIMGLNQETGLALSLVKRVRELVVGIPALILWHFVERRQLLNCRM